MSFVNLMASDIWSDADINIRVQAIIRGRFSAEDEMKAARLTRKPDASVDDLAFVADVDQVIESAINEGQQARIDNKLLIETLKYEQSVLRLERYRLSEGKPSVTGERVVIDEDGNEVIETYIIESEVPAIHEFIVDESGEEYPNPEIGRAHV